MEDYSKVEAEAHETPANEDSSSSDSDEEEKVVSESVGISEPDAAAELDATESETTRDSEVVLTDVGPKQTTLLPPDNDSTVDGVVVGFDNNAGNSSGFPEPALEQNVEDSSRPPTVPIVETRDGGGDGGGEVEAGKPDINETMETQPIPSIRHRLVHAISWRSCCGLFEVLRRRSDR